jgi:hypothetical protein
MAYRRCGHPPIWRINIKRSGFINLDPEVDSTGPGGQVRQAKVYPGAENTKPQNPGKR